MSLYSNGSVQYLALDKWTMQVCPETLMVARRNANSRHYLQICYRDKKVWWELCIRLFYQAYNIRRFRYYTMVRSLGGRPHLGGNMLDSDIFGFCHQQNKVAPTAETCISSGQCLGNCWWQKIFNTIWFGVTGRKRYTSIHHWDGIYILRWVHESLGGYSLSEQNTQFQSLAEFVLEKLRLKVIGYQAGLVSSTTGVHGLARLAIGLSVVLLVLVALYRKELKLNEESSLMRMHSITYHLFMAQNVIGR